MIEIFKPIIYHPSYEVSNLGRVRSNKRKTPSILKPGRKPQGYLYVGLLAGGAPMNEAVHNLVARAFIGPKPEGYVTCLMDGNKSNCELSNLKYLTIRESLSRGRKGKYKTGVKFNKKSKTWTASIQSKTFNDHLGTFKTEDEAHEAYLNAARLRDIK